MNLVDNNYAQHYLIYTRRSTDDPKHQQNSIRYQNEFCQRHALSQQLPIAPLTITGFCENGVIKERHTAYKTAPLEILPNGTVQYKIERPKFQQLVVLLSQRKIRGVICLCWDRFSRNDSDENIIKQLHAQGVDIRFVWANYERTSAGALHMDIDAMFAIYHSRNTSEKVRASNAELRAKGKWPNYSPVGYLDNGSDGKLLDPERSPIIRSIFEMYATGEWSLAQLAKWARAQGLTTKPRRDRRTQEEMLLVDEDEDENTRPQACRPITEKTIEHILHNPFYCGLLRYGTDILPGAHEPLISKDLFYRVQEVLEGRTTVVRYIDKPFFTYRGFVRCQCSRLFSPYEQKGHSYYRVPCQRECANTAANIPESQFDKFVEGILGRIAMSDQERALLESQAPKEFSRAAEQRAARETEFERQRVRMERDLAYLRENKIALLREGAYQPQQYAAEMARLEAALAQLHAQRQQTEGIAEPQMLETVLAFLELIKMAQLSYKYATPTEKRDFLIIGFFELILYNGKLANVRAKEGFGALLKRPVVPIGGPHFVFLELASIYQAVQISLTRLSSSGLIGASSRP